MSTTWTHCPECGCGPGEEHRRACSFWHRSRHPRESWKPTPKCEPEQGEDVE